MKEELTIHRIVLITVRFCDVKVKKKVYLSNFYTKKRTLPVLYPHSGVIVHVVDIQRAPNLIQQSENYF